MNITVIYDNDKVNIRIKEADIEIIYNQIPLFFGVNWHLKLALRAFNKAKKYADKNKVKEVQP